MRGTAPKQRDRAYVSFTERLLAREIRPGQFVSQRELVEITGMPLAAIRELVPRLEADGLIRTLPQRGMQIPHVDLGLIRNAFQFRLILEREAVAHFAAVADDAAIAELRRDHEEVLAQAERGPVTPDLIQRAQATDWAMHDTLVGSLDNPIVSEAHRVNSIKVRLIRQEQTRLDAERVAPVMREHLLVIAALAARDAAAAVQRLTDHIEEARTRALNP